VEGGFISKYGPIKGWAARKGEKVADRTRGEISQSWPEMGNRHGSLAHCNQSETEARRP
jgi:hypothetical protein